MNVYAFIPLVATITYIPLLIVTFGSHPRGQQRLFGWFLIAAIAWSLTDYIFRSNFFPLYSLLLLKIIILEFILVVVQLQVFINSFFPAGQKRWFFVSYGSLVFVAVLMILGYLPENVTWHGDKVVPQYGVWIYALAVPLFLLFGRGIAVLGRRIRNQSNPVVYNQTMSLLLALFLLFVFTVVGILPWVREYPLPHVGNIFLALIMNYAVLGQQLVDIRFALRRGLIWFTIIVIALAGYWILLLALNAVLRLNVNLTTGFIAYAAAVVISLVIYRLRRFFSRAMGRAFQGETYSYRQRLFEFANKIQNVFSLKDQGGELLRLVNKAIECKQAALLFMDADGENFVVQLIEPRSKDDRMLSFKLNKSSPIVDYLRITRKPLTREGLSIIPELKGLWEREKEEIGLVGLELFIPLISRDNLIGILVLTRRQNGRYSLEDFNLIEDVTNRVAVSMEKEYLREQLKEREEELSIINRSSAIITSSLDIQRIYDSFIQVLKKTVDVNWAAICLIERDELYFLALSTDESSAWQVGERIPIKGTATEWVAAQKLSAIEPDLSKESKFVTGKYYVQQGIRSIVYLPLMVADRVIGTLIVASRNTNAYGARHLKLLEHLASQIAMPIENARLYAETARMARNDELTGLLNRRSLNEMLASEIVRHSRYGGVFSLIVMDLDSFKSFNDTYGHLAGDEMLRQTGVIMRSVIREADQAFRYGGDEFAILLPQTSVEAAAKVADRLRQQVSAKVRIDSTPITISLGISCWPVDGIDTNEVIAAADAALYKAKREGGNRTENASQFWQKVGGITTSAKDDSESLSTIFALAATVDARDHYTRSHSKKVGEYAVALAEAINMEPLEVNKLGNCALLHDIGKIGISDEILKKLGVLTAQEMEAIKVHPQLGAAIVSHSRQLSPCIYGIVYHHERYDGSGYPKGLKGEDIPLESRILSIADAFAAMTSERSYSKALSYAEAVEELKRCAGTQFDPKLVGIFISAIKKVIPFAIENGAAEAKDQ